jgi:hypothetical protein
MKRFEMYEFITMIFVKFKVIIYSFVAAYIAATMRYFRAKRLNKKPSLNSWFAFGTMAFLVTFAFFSLLEYWEFEAPENIKLAAGFWVGYMADFFYSWIPKFIKTKLPDGKEIEKDSGDNLDDDVSDVSGNSDIR